MNLQLILLLLTTSIFLASAQECLPDNQRVDCHPDTGVTIERCLERGCNWCPSTGPGRNTPFCFFPPNYGYKMIADPINTGHGFIVQLQRNTTTTLFGGEVLNLTLEADFQSDYRLRIKIADNQPRWKVPLQIDPPSKNLTNDPLYNVEFTNEPVFSFKVIRKTTETVIFDSSLGGFTFADQFIQLGWKLPSTNVYGIGENEQHSFRHSFEDRPMYPLFSSGHFPQYQKNSYGVQPQYTVVEEDGNAHTVVIVNSNAQEFEMHPHPGIVYKTIGGILDMYFFLGPTPEKAVQQYSEAVGKFPLPPYWALGFHLCRYGYDSIEVMRETVDRMIAAEIPYEIQYGDIDIMDGGRDFTVSPDRFPGLNDYVKQLKTKGIRFITILDPTISTTQPRGTYPAFDLGQEMDVWVKRSDGVTPVHGRQWPDGTIYFPDYTKNSTREWWIRMIKEFHDNVLEFDALWIDMNEPFNFVHGDEEGCVENSLNNPPFYPRTLRDIRLFNSTLCADAQDSISSHYNTHSLYGWFQSEPTYAAANLAVGKRTFILSRSNFIGQSRWATHWLGDNYSNWENMHYSIIGLLQYSLFGMPFVGPDICGHVMNSEKELCQRWQELGAFYPFSRNHNANGQEPQDPAAFNGTIIESSKKALLVRYTLLPYLYTLLAKHEQDGSSVARALWNLYPEDVTTRGIDTQFFWGNGLMISPVLHPGHTTVQAYFPNGRFYDYYTGEEIRTRGNYTVLDAPLEHINVHLHGGIIIPTQKPAVNTDISRNNPFGLIVALDDNQEATGDFFFDDGESFKTIQTGNYFSAQISAANQTVKYLVQQNSYSEMGSKVLITIRLLGITNSPNKIIVNGENHANFTVLPSKEVLVQDLNLTANVNFVLEYQ